MNIVGMPTPSASNFPKVAVAFSGGGLRAMLSGAGVFDGLDSRSTTAKPNLKDGKPTVNGLLDWATYMTGISCEDGVNSRSFWRFMVDWCISAE